MIPAAIHFGALMLAYLITWGAAAGLIVTGALCLWDRWLG